MVTDARGHEVPADSDMWGYREDMGLLSESIADVRAVANQTAAQAAVSELEAGDIDATGTVWWFTSPGALYVYDGIAFKQLARQDELNNRLPEAGLASVPNPGPAESGSLTITFASGKFSSAPAVVTSPNTQAPRNIQSAVTGVSASGATLTATRGDSNSSTPVHYIASARAATAMASTRQMAPPEAFTADGDDDEMELELIEVTCPTEWCGNYDIPIVLYAPPGGAVACGVCGAALTPNVPDGS